MYTCVPVSIAGLMFFCILFNYTILRDTKDSAPAKRVLSPFGT